MHLEPNMLYTTFSNFPQNLFLLQDVEHKAGHGFYLDTHYCHVLKSCELYGQSLPKPALPFQSHFHCLNSHPQRFPELFEQLLISLLKSNPSFQNSFTAARIILPQHKPNQASIFIFKMFFLRTKINFFKMLYGVYCGLAVVMPPFETESPKVPYMHKMLSGLLFIWLVCSLMLPALSTSIPFAQNVLPTYLAFTFFPDTYPSDS